MGIRREGAPRYTSTFSILTLPSSISTFPSSRGSTSPSSEINCQLPHHISGIRAKVDKHVHPIWSRVSCGNQHSHSLRLILRSQEESKVQIEFLKTTKSADALPLATAVLNDALPTPAPEDQKEESPWDAVKRGAKSEVTAFDGSLDPKKYMDWEVGLDEYFDWYQLPEGGRIQFAQMKVTGQARIYWRNIQVTMERRHEPMITSWAEMKSRLRDKFVPACYRPIIIDEWQHLRQGEGTVTDYIARFDDLMICCNIDEEPMATLARFCAGL